MKECLLEKPPFQHGELNEYEREWIKDINYANHNCNYKCIKPKIAKIHFETNTRSILFNKDDLIPPYKYEDKDARVMDEQEVYRNVDHLKHDFDEQHYGLLLTGDDMELEEQTNPFVNLLKNTGMLNKSKWEPSLHTVKEEKINELQTLKRYNDDGCKYIYSKQLKDKMDKLSAKINKSIKSKSGIYCVQVDTTTTAQNNGGVNRSVTGLRHLLLHYKEIEPYPIGGVNDKEVAIHCTGIGYLPWTVDNGEITLVKCFYCPEVNGTILSPNDIVLTHKDRFCGWDMHTDCDKGIGEFKLRACDGVSHICFEMFMENNLWFHYLEPISQQLQNHFQHASRSVVRSLTDSAQYEIWHHRLGHPGRKATEMMHKHTHGIPRLRPNQFHCCTSCMVGKFRKTKIGNKREINTHQSWMQQK